MGMELVEGGFFLSFDINNEWEVFFTTGVYPKTNNPNSFNAL
jgi:hypothetical protein